MILLLKLNLFMKLKNIKFEVLMLLFLLNKQIFQLKN